MLPNGIRKAPVVRVVESVDEPTANVTGLMIGTGRKGSKGRVDPKSGSIIKGKSVFGDMRRHCPGVFECLTSANHDSKNESWRHSEFTFSSTDIRDWRSSSVACDTYHLWQDRHHLQTSSPLSASSTTSSFADDDW